MWCMLNHQRVRWWNDWVQTVMLSIENDGGRVVSDSDRIDIVIASVPSTPTVISPHLVCVISSVLMHDGLVGRKASKFSLGAMQNLTVCPPFLQLLQIVRWGVNTGRAMLGIGTSPLCWGCVPCEARNLKWYCMRVSSISSIIEPSIIASAKVS